VVLRRIGHLRVVSCHHSTTQEISGSVWGKVYKKVSKKQIQQELLGFMQIPRRSFLAWYRPP
jgi:hypothetical protein